MAQTDATTLPALLRERAFLQPDDIALTFMDYDQDWDGVALSLTWPQLYRRTVNLARELGSCGSAPGDRVLIIAPQGIEYIVGFLGALQAGMIPVPLAVPFGGVADERVESVLRDAAPTAVLTTSSVIDAVVQSVSAQHAPTIIEVDRLDLDAATPAGAEFPVAGWQSTAYLQYTSGSTRSPAGVMISYQNVVTNLRQICTDFLPEGFLANPPSIVSWLPFFHDLGLLLGICTPVIMGFPTTLTSPISFLQRPARWMQLAADSPRCFTSAPNFAFELAVRKTSDQDMAGRDLAGVDLIQSGAERVQPPTLKRFAEHFGRFNLSPAALLPSYGLAEATLYVATSTPHAEPRIVNFEPEALTTGTAKRTESSDGTPLVSYGIERTPISPLVRIVDPDTGIECPNGVLGEIWTHGDNVSAGYWQKPEETARTFGNTLVPASPGTPTDSWLRTGDRGFMSGDEMFVVGRIKDLLIIYGQNHAPDDIEATVQKVTGGRAAAIAVPVDGSEQLVVVIETKTKGDSAEDYFATLKREITSAISNTHGLAVADLVLVGPGSIPITTSGKIRRSASSERYQGNEFQRLDA